MRPSPEPLRLHNTRVEFVMLVVASVSCVVALTVGIAGGGKPVSSEVTLKLLLAIAVTVAVAGLAAAAAWQSSRISRRIAERAEAESAELRRALTTTEAVLRAEAQVLILWEQGQGLKVVTHTLSSVPGLPQETRELLRFGGWLTPTAAAELKGGLDGLFADGRPFNLILKTAADGHLEADGRASGGRAVLRLRDIAGYKRDLVRILDQHRKLTRDVEMARGLLDALPCPVWFKGDDGRIDWVNAAYVRAAEAASRTEVTDTQIELLEIRQREQAEKLVTKGEAFRRRTSLTVGKERRAHDVVMLPFGAARAGAAIDVAELETARQTLERQGAAYDRTLDRVATAIAVFNAEKRLTFFNDAYRKLWSLDDEWLQSGRTDSEILDRLRELGRLPEIVNYREWKAKWLAVYKSGAEQEDWWHLPGGRVLHAIAEPRLDGGVAYLYNDETERLALESRYNGLISVQRETLDSLKEGVAVFGPDGRLKLFNRAFATIWKLSRRQLEESPHVEEIVRQAQVLYADPRAWAQVKRAVTALSDESEAAEGQMMRPDGLVIDFASTRLPDGATLLTFADVTDVRRYERALEERNEALVAADRLKNQFIGHISYELRTPLTNIIGFSDLLASPHVGRLNEKQREYLGDLTSSSRTLLALIDDIIDLATIDAGAMELTLSRVSVKSVIDTALGGVRERAMRARLTLDIGIEDENATFMADEHRIGQILSNILSNAVGFSPPEGTVQISCWSEAGDIVLRVADQGVGIPKDQQRRVFDRFESQSHGSKHRGAGLGLSIVKSLVELHGGVMTLESEPGQGTRVTVRIPKGEAAQAPAIASRPQSRPAALTKSA